MSEQTIFASLKNIIALVAKRKITIASCVAHWLQFFRDQHFLSLCPIVINYLGRSFDQCPTNGFVYVQTLPVSIRRRL